MNESSDEVLFPMLEAGRIEMNEKIIAQIVAQNSDSIKINDFLDKVTNI